MKKQTIADLSLLGVTFVWGAGFLLVQTAIATLEPFTFNGLRFLIAAVFLLLWMYFFHRNAIKRMIDRSLLSAGIILGVWLFLGFALQTFGLLYTTTSKAGFITGLNVVLVPIFAIFMLKERPKLLSLVGVAAAAIGLYLLTMGDSFTVNAGDLLVLLCAFAFALQIILTGKYTQRFSALALTAVQLTTVAFLNILSALLFEDWQAVFNPEVLLKQEVVSGLLITAILGTSLAFLAQTAFQKVTSSTRVAVIYAMEPVFAALTGVIWAGERLTEVAFIGAALIFVGMILSELAGMLQVALNRVKSAIGGERV